MSDEPKSPPPSADAISARSLKAVLVREGSPKASSSPSPSPPPMPSPYSPKEISSSIRPSLTGTLLDQDIKTSGSDQAEDYLANEKNFAPINDSSSPDLKLTSPINVKSRRSSHGHSHAHGGVTQHKGDNYTMQAYIPLSVTLLLLVAVLFSNIPKANQWYPSVDHGATFAGWKWQVPPLDPLFAQEGDNSSSLSCMEGLHARLATNHTVNVFGKPGAGKSALVAAYAHQNADQFSVIIWLRASSLVELTSDLHRLARHLNLRVHELSSKAYADRVLAFLYKQKSWLLVLDDVTPDTASIDILKEFIPRLKVLKEPEAPIVSPRPALNMGKVIFTSRFKFYPNTLEVPAFAPAVFRSLGQRHAEASKTDWAYFSTVGALGAADYAKLLALNPLALRTSISLVTAYSRAVTGVVKDMPTAAAWLRTKMDAAKAAAPKEEVALAKSKVAYVLAAAARAVCELHYDACQVLRFLTALPAALTDMAFLRARFVDHAHKFSSAPIDLESALETLHGFGLAERVAKEVHPDRQGKFHSFFSLHPLVRQVALAYRTHVFDLTHAAPAQATTMVRATAFSPVGAAQEVLETAALFAEVDTKRFIRSVDIHSVVTPGDVFGWTELAAELTWIHDIYAVAPALSTALHVLGDELRAQDAAQFYVALADLPVYMLQMLGHHLMVSLNLPRLAEKAYATAAAFLSVRAQGGDGHAQTKLTELWVNRAHALIRGFGATFLPVSATSSASSSSSTTSSPSSSASPSPSTSANAASPSTPGSATLATLEDLLDKAAEAIKSLDFRLPPDFDKDPAMGVTAPAPSPSLSSTSSSSSPSSSISSEHTPIAAYIALVRGLVAEARKDIPSAIQLLLTACKTATAYTSKGNMGNVGQGSALVPNLLTAYLYRQLAGVYLQAERLDDCFGQHQIALQIQSTLLGERSPLVQRHYTLISKLWADRGKNRELNLVYRTFNLAKALYDEFDPRYAEASAALGMAYYHSSKDRAVKPLEDALKVEVEAAGEVHLRVAQRRVQVADVYFDLGKLDRAVYHYLEVYHVYMQLYGTAHPTTVGSAQRCIHVHDMHQQHLDTMKRNAAAATAAANKAKKVEI